MTPSQALGLFAGIPIAFALLVVIAVNAGSWMRGDRDSQIPGVGQGHGSLFVASAGSAPDPSRLPREIGMNAGPVAAGGADGTW